MDRLLYVDKTNKTHYFKTNIEVSGPEKKKPIVLSSIFRGMTVTSGVVNIDKDDSNLIGISIGGGAPLCPCLYVVQVFKLSMGGKTFCHINQKRFCRSLTTLRSRKRGPSNPEMRLSASTEFASKANPRSKSRK